MGEPSSAFDTFIGAAVLAEWREGESKIRLTLNPRPWWIPKPIYRWLLRQLLVVTAEAIEFGLNRGLPKHRLNVF